MSIRLQVILSILIILLTAVLFLLFLPKENAGEQMQNF